MNSNEIDVIFRLKAEVNGVRFNMDGHGIGRKADGVCTLQLTADPGFPEGFDPVSCPMICSHPTSLFFAQASDEDIDLSRISGGSYEVRPARVGMLYDSAGKTQLSLQVSGKVYFEDGVLYSENEMWGTSHLEPLEQLITPVEDYIHPGKGRTATAATRYQMRAKSGAILEGMTLVPYAWKNGAELGASVARQVHDIRVQWDGGRHVSAFYRISVGRITEQRPVRVSAQ